MKFTVMVPCSTSNLGAGFDAIGIALGGPDLIVRVRDGGAGLHIGRIQGEGEDRLPKDESNRILVAARNAAESAGLDPRGLEGELDVHSSIPLKRGLGSSATAALAGALIADRLLGGKIGQERILATAVALEGHPDNVVPSLLGGAQVSVRDGSGQVRSCAIPLGMTLKAALYVPDEELSTSAARAVLPQQVPLADAVHNLGRSALFVAALAQGRADLLGEAMDDRLHQPARAGLLPWLPRLLDVARKAGAAGAALSGAGTTVCALCTPESAKQVALAMLEAATRLGVAGRSEVVEVGVPGARIVSE